jgi:hypothetical protein
MDESEILKPKYQPGFYNPESDLVPQKEQKDFVEECITLLNKTQNKTILIETRSDVGNHELTKWICTVKKGRIAKTYDDLEFKLISL